LTTQQNILSIAGIIGALVVILGAVLSIYKIARRLDDALAVDEQGRSVSERMSRVEHQLWENGGSSLADRLNQNCRVTDETATEVRFIKDVLLTILGQNVAEAQKTPKRKTTTRTTSNLAFGLQTPKNTTKK
jgi:hypothetical protein